MFQFGFLSDNSSSYEIVPLDQKGKLRRLHIDQHSLRSVVLGAFYARAYGLTREELRYILDPAGVKALDYPSETFRVLKEKEIRKHGEYRTGRLVLEAWDRMDANGEFTAMGMR